MTPREIIQEALESKDLKSVVLFTQDMSGRWSFNFSDMPVEFLCFTHHLLGSVIAHRIDGILQMKLPVVKL